MKDKINVMVTAAGSFCAVNIIKSLRLAKRYRVIATDINAMSAGLFCADAGYIVPKEGPDGRFIDRIIEIAKKERVCAIIPGFDTELPYFSVARDVFKNAGIHLIIGNEMLIRLSNDKLATARFLIDNGIRAPKSFSECESEDAFSQLSFPLIVKPNSGWGSRYVTVAHHRKEALESMQVIKKQGFIPVIQELIEEGEGEFTVGIAVATDGDILGIIPMKRELVKGDSRKVWVDEYPDVAAQAKQIIQKIRSPGAINLQGRFKDGIFTVFEINARFSTTNFVRALCGFNEVDALIRNFVFGEKTSLKADRKAVAVAFLEYALVDKDTFAEIEQKRETFKKGEVTSLM